MLKKIVMFAIQTTDDTAWSNKHKNKKKLFSFKKPAVRLHKTVCESQLIFPLPLEMECFKQTGRVQFVYKMVNEYTTICLMHVFILL